MNSKGFIADQNVNTRKVKKKTRYQLDMRKYNFKFYFFHVVL